MRIDEFAPVKTCIDSLMICRSSYRAAASNADAVTYHAISHIFYWAGTLDHKWHPYSAMLSSIVSAKLTSEYQGTGFKTRQVDKSHLRRWCSLMWPSKSCNRVHFLKY